MKAMVYHHYGSPDVLELQEIDKPVINDDEVLVKVHAASLNWLDWHFLTGRPFLARLMSGLLKPKHNVLGVDVAGRVEAVGANVEEFQPGDAVFGSTDKTLVFRLPARIKAPGDLCHHRLLPGPGTPGWMDFDDREPENGAARPKTARLSRSNFHKGAS